MPNINDAFPSKYLKVSDLGGTEPVVTIDRVEWEPVGRDREMKAVLYFAGKKKAIVLNKTMATKLTSITGSADTDHWGGHKVKLYASEATFGSDTYDVVRIKEATNGSKPVARKPVPPPPPVEDVLDTDISEDEIPF
jgi:hypothetical protein